MPKIIFRYLLVTIFSLYSAFAETLSGKVIGVKDGDTIEVLVAQEPLTVRLARVDCPEKKQAFGSVAKKVTSDKIYGEVVSLQSVKKDRYGRMIGDVYYGDKLTAHLNRELVEEGICWWYEKYDPKNIAFKKLEASARDSKKGLWIDKDPTPPWEFRHR